MYVAIIFYLDVTYVSQICVQLYVSNVSVLCCSKWFHIASYKSTCFVCFTHMLQVHVPNVSSAFGRMLDSNVFLCCKCFKLYCRGQTGGELMDVRCAGGKDGNGYPKPDYLMGFTQ